MAEVISLKSRPQATDVLDVQGYMRDLRRPFPVGAVSFRVGGSFQWDGKTRHQIFTYITAQVARDRFDKVVPGQATWVLRPGPFEKSLECCITIDGQSRSDAATLKPTQGRTTEGDWDKQVKGVYSDAFKRAAVAWGVAEYLKDLPDISVELPTGASGKPKLTSQVIKNLQERYLRWVETDAIVAKYGTVLEIGTVQEPTGQMPVDEEEGEEVSPDPVGDSELKSFRRSIVSASTEKDLAQVGHAIKGVRDKLTSNEISELQERYRVRLAFLRTATIKPIGDAEIRPDVDRNPRVSPTVKECPECHSPMRMRTGSGGQFWGCSGYPACKHTEQADRALVGADTYALPMDEDEVPPPVSGRTEVA